MSKPAMPNDATLNIALLWLENNEGDEHEKGACLAVRDWIDALMQERVIRSAAKSAGVPVAALRQKIAEREARRKATP